MIFTFVYRAITVTFFCTCLVQGIPRFTQEPPSVLYVSSGGTARLVWDYNVEHRRALFDPYSPEWSFYNSSGGKVLIGVEDGFNGWKFVPYKNCPARLRGRVSKESTATLVISNVTTADSGIYGCDLVLIFESPIRSKVQLIVTERPRFTTTVHSKTPVIVGSNLSIQCSAVANPMPNVTWVRTIMGQNIISAGFGEAFLRFNNITRDQSGTYECEATNNPNDDPVKMRTIISVEPTPTSSSLRTLPKYPLETTFHNGPTTSKTVVSKRKDKRKALTRQSMYFFQGLTFAIIHLTITSVLLVIIGVLITCFCTKVKSNTSKVSDNREEISRFAIPGLAQTADEDPRAVALTNVHQPQETNDLAVNASNVSASKVYENVSEKSETSFDSGNAAEEARTNFQFSQPRHVYQELNNSVLMSNAQRYQTLHRTLEDNATKIQLNFPPPKYEELKSGTNNAQGSEYQKLHLYASIGDKK